VNTEYPREINPLTEPHVARTVTLAWTDPELAAITRIRFVGDSWTGPMDLSYCHGTARDGTPVRVQLPVYQVMGGRWIKPQLVTAAKADGIFLAGLCGGSIDDVLSVIW